MRRMKTSLLWNWFWKITTKSMLFWKEKLPISENGVQLGKIRSPLRSVILSNCSILQGLIYQGMSASPWLSHPGPAKALNMSRKIWKCFLPPWCRNWIKLWTYHKKLWPCCWKSCGGWMSGGSLWLLSWNHGNKQFTKLRFRRRRSPNLDIGSSIPGNWKSDLDPGGKSPRPSPRLAK